MGLWVLAVALPVAVSTVVAVSACMLSSRRNQSLERPQSRAAEKPVLEAESIMVGHKAPASPTTR